MSLSHGETTNMEAIPPTEDLMREHGVLKRILLIYREVIKRLIGETPNEPQIIASVLYSTASIARQFIEDYHQHLEDQYVFPKFLKAQKHIPLVQVLSTQHKAARQMTSIILKHSRALNYNSFSERYYLAHILSLYIRMYEPHEAREDTDLFPDLRNIVTASEFKKLGDLFEEIEEKRFGTNGFQRIVQQISRIEQALGIHDLSQFTPQPSELYGGRR